MDPLDPEQVRAETVVLMAAHAAITPRGWDDQKRRARLHERIDEQLDDWLLLTSGDGRTAPTGRGRAT